MQTIGSTSSPDCVALIRTDARTQILLDVYEIYQLVQKHFQGKESTIQTFATLLTDTYKMYTGNKVSILILFNITLLYSRSYGN